MNFDTVLLVFDIYVLLAHSLFLLVETNNCEKLEDLIVDTFGEPNESRSGSSDSEGMIDTIILPWKRKTHSYVILVN